MKSKFPLFLIGVLFVVGCKSEQNKESSESKLRFEKINYYKSPYTEGDKPIKFRVEYYFDNGKSHRWSELDSLEKSQVEYIYTYDDNFNHIGARYKEPDEPRYNIEKVRFLNDSTQVTEWIDSVGQVFYTMTDNLNKYGKTYRAEFKGKKIDGYDSTFYNSYGLEKRIFFTNIKGKVFNDRTFGYEVVDGKGNWSERVKIMDSKVVEIQKREFYFDQNFTAADGKFYPGVISTGELSENVFSFSSDENIMFLTRTEDWDRQTAFIAQKKNGLYTETSQVEELDSIYNGSISPNGNRIIYTTKDGDNETTWLYNLKDKSNINITKNSGISAGYFYWLTEDELYFYQEIEGGNIYSGILKDNKLTVKDAFDSVNTESAEFSPYMDPEKRFIIFTRYKEKDGSQQGFFISYQKDGKWSEAEKIQNLPYGWNARIIQNGTQFLYTDGEDIYSVPISTLNLKI